jgi:predicted ATP-grasp superfamily ATP-dependent carboligase
MAEVIFILGASVRAAAFSALRAGLSPYGSDLFADVDLHNRCPIFRLRGRYPHAFLDGIDAAPPGPWMYTGGLENWPHLVHRMATHRTMWGNDAATLRRCRSPWFVRHILQSAGLRVPAVCRHAPASGRWLIKPLRGAGGAGIRLWDQSFAAVGREPAAVYFQELIDGIPAAALYLADGERCRLLGVTRQLVGERFLHAADFHYCGSLGPLIPTNRLRTRLEQLGGVLAMNCGLRGLFGVDGVLRDDTFWPVEINPRYTASVEVLEYATTAPMLKWHAHVFTHGRLPPPAPPTLAIEGTIGKAILFARADVLFPADGPWMSEARSPKPIDELPAFADIPAAGERIEAGRPILTFFVRAGSFSDAEDSLRRIAADLDRRLFER